ncbi:hypothetical protein OROGR_023951 [Orobanche gracilis]
MAERILHQLIKRHNLLIRCSLCIRQRQSLALALENVEEALLRLEELLHDLHVSSSSSGKEHLKAACSDLERIRRLKKETEFLEASFRAKAAFLQQGEISGLRFPVGEQQQYSRGKGGKSSETETDRSSSNDEIFEQEDADNEIADSEADDIQRFELLKSELMELEKRVQKSSDRYEYDEDKVLVKDDVQIHDSDAKGSRLVPVQKKDSIIGKSLDKLKETSTV